jgi:20S proteasome alpha/beta subunit
VLHSGIFLWDGFIEIAIVVVRERSNIMDTVVGVCYKGGGKSFTLVLNLLIINLLIIKFPLCGFVTTTTVIIAADQSNGRSILTYQTNLDKIAKLTSHSLMGVSGPNCDLVNFTEYISKSINYYQLSNDGTKLSTHGQANFARGELATALRKGPYQVNVLLGGYDESKGGSLYHIDYMGTMHKVKNGAQGYAQYFVSSIFDKDCTDSMTEEDALQVVEKCIREIHTRFLISQPNFIIKKVDKDGVKVLSFGGDPADT